MGTALDIAAAGARPVGPIAVVRDLPRRLAQGLRWGAWFVSGLVAFLVLTHPVSPDAQLTLSLSAIALMTAVWLLTPRTRLTRMLFLSLGSMIVIRYVYWRATSTLPPITDPLSFGLGLLLLVAEMYCVLILAISLIINADPLERDPPAFDEAHLPTVDVFIPTYNEDEYILATTVAAAKAMDYPPDKLTVWLLDDGGSDQKCRDRDPAKASAAKKRRESLQKLCAELGARYLTRAKNEHAKAGNMNNGLKHSTGDIVVVFDADHAPFRSFLRETIGHFAADPKLFLVQTPHVFLNPDPIERNLRTFHRMPSENEMFYGVTQRGLDKWNGSFFCGSAALLRRKALEVTGGFSGITITEDCETAFELHAMGWTSVYVDKPLIAGLQPETFDSFIGQRSRWCQGMFQIMILKNPAVKPGLEMIQRLAYLSSMTFWFFPLPRLAFMLAPLLHIFLDVKIFVSSIDEAVAYTATYVVVNLMIQNYLYGHVRWPWVSELYEYVQGVFLAKAIVSVIARPRKPTFNVTAKGLSLEEEHLSSLAKPYIAIYLLLLAGCVTAGFRYVFEPGVTNLMLVVGLWCLFNLIIAGAALGAVAERPPTERIPGLGIDRRGTLLIGGKPFPVTIERVSSGDCTARLLDTAVNLPSLDIPLLGQLTVETKPGERPVPPLRALIGRGSAEDPKKLNVAFTQLATGDYVTIAELMYGDAGQLASFLRSRRKHKDVLTGTAQFIAWGLLEPVRALRIGVTSLRAKRKAAAAAPAADSTALVLAETSKAALPVVAPTTAVVVAEPTTRIAAPAEPIGSGARRGTALSLTAEQWLAAILQLARDGCGEPEHPRSALPAPALSPPAWRDAILDLARRELEALPPPAPALAPASALAA